MRIHIDILKWTKGWAGREEQECSITNQRWAQERVGPRSLPDLRRARGAGGGGGGGGGAGAPVTLMALQKKAVASLYLPAIEPKRRPETVKP